MTSPGANLSRLCGKPATNRLSNGTVLAEVTADTKAVYCPEQKMNPVVVSMRQVETFPVILSYTCFFLYYLLGAKKVVGSNGDGSS
jgi:hypothetical protein